MAQQDDRQARERRDEIIAEYRDAAESAMNCWDESFESAMTVMLLPPNLHKYYRTSNHIERLNKELIRKSKVIGIFPNEASMKRIMGSFLVEYYEQELARPTSIHNSDVQENNVIKISAGIDSVGRRASPNAGRVIAADAP